MLDVRKWAFGVFLALAFSSKALAWGAIAVAGAANAEADGVTYGVSTGKSTPDAAKFDAAGQCQKKGAGRCQVVVTFQGCGAFAVAPYRGGAGSGPDRSTAERAAMQRCGSMCKLVTSTCE